MRKLIRLGCLLLIGYCVVQLARTCDDSAQAESAQAEEYACYFGTDFSEVYSVMAKSRKEAEDKVLTIEPFYNYELFCKPRKNANEQM